MGDIISKDEDLFGTIKDRYKKIEDVTEALEKAGLESSDLVVGIDFTGSNQVQGERTFGGKSLHHIEDDVWNPYQKVISIVGRTLSKFDEDNLIPVYGFGDVRTRDFGVFSLTANEQPCLGFETVLKEYEKIAPHVDLCGIYSNPNNILLGPTNFAPIVNKAVEILCQSTRTEYHILVIIADGQVDNKRETMEAIKNASNYPLSIITVGVGDGPWDSMVIFDDDIVGRKFDNFQFVDYDEVVSKARKSGKDPDVEFSVAALMEIPQQYTCIRKLGLLGKKVHPITKKLIM